MKKMSYKIMSFEDKSWDEIPSEKNPARINLNNNNKYLTICRAKIYKFENEILNRMYIVKDSEENNKNVGLFWDYKLAYIFAENYVNVKIFDNMCVK